MARCAAELRGAAARADGSLAGDEPTSNCRGSENKIEASQHTKKTRRARYCYLCGESLKSWKTHVESSPTVDCRRCDRGHLCGRSCNQK